MINETAMSEHAMAMVQWAGPTVLTIFGIIVCFGLRTAYKSFEKILKRNEDEHLHIFELLRNHQIKLSESEIRYSSMVEKGQQLLENERRQDELLLKHGDRLTRVETQVDIAKEDIEKLKARGT